MKFAVIKTGGKQYLVKEGETLSVELLSLKEGDKVDFNPLLLADEAAVKVGKPEVVGAKVVATVVTHGRGEKIKVIKFHRKVRYKKTYGHRQPFTQIKIEKISA
jgi:large subunit ribosomal protein L21